MKAEDGGCRAWHRRCRAAARRVCPAASAVRGSRGRRRGAAGAAGRRRAVRGRPQLRRHRHRGSRRGRRVGAPSAAGLQLPARGRAEPVAFRRRQPRPVPRRRPPTPARSGSALLVDTFLQDCAPEVQAQAADHLARQSVRGTEQPVGAAAGQQVPSTYLVCAQDRGTPPRLQREFARRAGGVVELDAGHHSFLSQPEAVRVPVC
ncbi:MULTISPECIES: alpha/beta fold hydrolase [Streptomyces violaceusniger group]|uniref:Alpha/beta hydrolase n=1 Tax=Streptomyces antimycoticus TaxID=68175 RepID=A0ABD5JBI5_9ACTN|nr:alpha/beta hydrolase [Streptomyces sp. DSM 41602]